MRPGLMMLVALMCWAGLPAEAFGAPGNRAAPDASCVARQLASARVTASLRMAHHGRTHTEATSVVTVRVPASWPLAPDLLLSEDSDGYRRALRCLVQEEAGSQRYRPDEWRRASPSIVSEDKEMRVRLETYTWVNERMVAVGPWHIEAGHTRWTIRFRAPAALRSARWDSIEADPGAPGAESVFPKPSAGRGTHALVWTPRSKATEPAPEIRIRMAPPWQRVWAARDGRDMSVFSFLGILLWVLAIAALATAATRHTRDRSTHTMVSLEEKRAARRLTDWVWLSIVIGVCTSIRINPWSLQASPGIALSTATGVLMFVLGRPGRFVVAVAVSAGAVAVAVPMFLPSTGALIVANVLALSVLLCGVLSWGWHLMSPHRSPAWRLLGPVSASLAALLVGCHLWLSERDWQRMSWLSDHSAEEYTSRHGEHLVNGLERLAVDSAQWVFSYDIILTGLAAFALLKIRGTAPHTRCAVPTAPDVLLMLLLYTVIISRLVGYYLNNSALIWLGVLLDIAAVRTLLLVGDRWSVLAQQLETSRQPLLAVFTESHRADFLHRSRQYRELHATLRRLEHNQPDEPTVARAAIERRLRALHRWRPSRQTGDRPAMDRLPSRVTVVDVVLAWGPRATWWENGCRAATYAALFAAPASALMTWRIWLQDGSWEQTTFGVVDTALELAIWELAWVGAGFLLGALWRVLPGRRGPARALSLALAYALPTGLNSLGVVITDDSHSHAALDLSLTLLILTVTAIAMDLETFHGERRYWPSRFSLLLSVYQMRYISLQAAYLIAQIVAAITIWQFITDDGGLQETPVKLQP